MVLVLDTNVLSELMKPAGASEVMSWLARQELVDLFTTAITRAEILSGIAILPAGKRRDAIEAAALAMFTEDFRGRVLAFDDRAAASYAEIFARRRSAGRPAPTLDLMVAAIAHSHSAGVVTRDVSGFEGFGVTVVDPWR
jgi:predicted nucleic acid-binding protein